MSRLKYLPIALLMPACTSTIVIESVPKAELTVHDWNNLDGAGEPLGETPLRTTADKLEGKIIKLKAQDVSSQYIAFPAPSQGVLRMKIDLLAADERQKQWISQERARESEGGQSGAPMSSRTVNELNRKLLACFQAMLDGDHQSAFVLAEQVAKDYPRVAAGRILAAIAKLYLGDSEAARSQLKLAQTLDPDDTSLGVMLKSLQ